MSSEGGGGSGDSEDKKKSRSPSDEKKKPSRSKSGDTTARKSSSKESTSDKVKDFMKKFNAAESATGDSFSADGGRGRSRRAGITALGGQTEDDRKTTRGNSLNARVINDYRKGARARSRGSPGPPITRAATGDGSLKAPGGGRKLRRSSSVNALNRSRRGNVLGAASMDGLEALQKRVNKGKPSRTVSSQPVARDSPKEDDAEKALKKVATESPFAKAGATRAGVSSSLMDDAQESMSSLGAAFELPSILQTSSKPAPTPALAKPAIVKRKISFPGMMEDDSKRDSNASSASIFEQRGEKDLRQVDQSVNLMDAEAGNYSKAGDSSADNSSSTSKKKKKKDKKPRKSVIEIMFGGGEKTSFRNTSLKDINLGPDPTNRRQTHFYLQQQRNDPWQQFTSNVASATKPIRRVLCSAPFLAMIVIIITLVFWIPYIQDKVNSLPPPAPTASPTTAPKTPEPTREATPEPTAATQEPTPAPVKVSAVAEGTPEQVATEEKTLQKDEGAEEEKSGSAEVTKPESLVDKIFQLFTPHSTDPPPAPAPATESKSSNAFGFVQNPESGGDAIKPLEYYNATEAAVWQSIMEQLLEVESLVLNNNLSDPELLNDPTSPQHEALTWLVSSRMNANEDSGRRLDDVDDLLDEDELADPNIRTLERYVAAVLFFSMHDSSNLEMMQAELLAMGYDPEDFPDWDASIVNYTTDIDRSGKGRPSGGKPPGGRQRGSNNTQSDDEEENSESRDASGPVATFTFSYGFEEGRERAPTTEEMQNMICQTVSYFSDFWSIRKGKGGNQTSNSNSDSDDDWRRNKTMSGVDEFELEVKSWDYDEDETSPLTVVVDLRAYDGNEDPLAAGELAEEMATMDVQSYINEYVKADEETNVFHWIFNMDFRGTPADPSMEDETIFSADACRKRNQEGDERSGSGPQNGKPQSDGPKDSSGTKTDEEDTESESDSGEDETGPVSTFSFFYGFTAGKEREPTPEELENMFCETTDYFSDFWSIETDSELNMTSDDDPSANESQSLIHKFVLEVTNWTYDASDQDPLKLVIDVRAYDHEGEQITPTLVADELKVMNVTSYIRNYIWLTEPAGKSNLFYWTERLFFRGTPMTADEEDNAIFSSKSCHRGNEKGGKGPSASGKGPGNGSNEGGNDGSNRPVGSGSGGPGNGPLGGDSKNSTRPPPPSNGTYAPKPPRPQGNQTAGEKPPKDSRTNAGNKPLQSDGNGDGKKGGSNQKTPGGGDGPREPGGPQGGGPSSMAGPEGGGNATGLTKPPVPRPLSNQTDVGRPPKGNGTEAGKEGSLGSGGEEKKSGSNDKGDQGGPPPSGSQGEPQGSGSGSGSGERPQQDGGKDRPSGGVGVNNATSSFPPERPQRNQTDQVKPFPGNETQGGTGQPKGSKESEGKQGVGDGKRAPTESPTTESPTTLAPTTTPPTPKPRTFALATRTSIQTETKEKTQNLRRLRDTLLHGKWMSDISICNWKGIDCDAGGQVIELDLSGKLLKGTIPDEIKGFKHLNSLNLSENHFHGSIPDGVTELEHLEELFLQENKLTGGIPVSWKATPLKILQLDHNQLDGNIPPSLGNLTDIQEIWLNHNSLSGPIPVELQDLPSLEKLHLEGNSLTGLVPAFPNGASLKTLRLHHNDFSGAIPQSLCDFDMKYLSSDCESEIECLCCDQCY